MRLRCLTVFAAGLVAIPQIVQAQTQPPVYTGEAFVASARALGLVNVTIEDTGRLPSNGGSLSTELLHANIPNLLDLNLLDASTKGGNNRTDSHANVATVVLSVPGVYVTADVLTSDAASCSPGQASASGSSIILGLRVNGLSVTVTGEPNQTVPLIVGSLVINEQISSVTTSPTLSAGDMVVNALHLRVNFVADVIISSSHAGVTCKGVVGIVG